jgi:predicted O-linked N-acetylglucosamine transferase (SPINDLY family)
MTNEFSAKPDVYAQALASYRRGQLDEARVLCERLLPERVPGSDEPAEGCLQPRIFDALHLLGIIALQTHDPQRAIDLIGDAIAINPQSAAAHNHRGSAFLALGQCEAAIASCDRAIALQPDYADAHYNRGNAFFDQALHEAAIESYNKAIAFKVNYAPAHNNRGLALWRLKQYEAAIASYDKAIGIQPNNADAYHYRGHALRDLRRFQAAIQSYDAAIAIQPDCAEAHNGRGSTLAALKQYEAALQSYDKAIAVHAAFAEAYLNRGNVLHELGRSAPAQSSYDQAIAINPRFAEAYYKRADLHRVLGHFEAAVEDFDRAFAITPDLKFLRGLRWHMRMRLCDWREFETDVAQLTASIERGEAACLPFPVLALTASAALQKKTAQIYVREECPPDSSLPRIPKRGRRRKIHIGYFSPDFRHHPVSLLTAELFETHDRSAFEVSAFSIGPDSHDEMRTRLQKAFDRFIDVRERSDRDIALLARTMELDIAIDLGGFTGECRPAIFAMRAAPLQVSYIGYLGSMAAPYIDYLIADTTTVPPGARRHYSEKILYLPSYQVNDSKRRVADKVFTREELGLPASGFVFCCFNTAYKITPPTYAGWMRILEKVPTSVMFLYAGMGAIEDNLRKETLREGVDPARVIFGNALPHPEYLARYRAMDLFLDTLPYNAGTTASDALWAGLPVLTCPGEAFASRMAASLLTAIEMPELIAPTQARYEALAVELATDPQRLAKIKQQLADRQLTTPLFNTPRFTRHLEAGYREIFERYQAGLPAEDTYGQHGDYRPRGNVIRG